MAHKVTVRLDPFRNSDAHCQLLDGLELCLEGLDFLANELLNRGVALAGSAAVGRDGGLRGKPAQQGHGSPCSAVLMHLNRALTPLHPTHALTLSLLPLPLTSTHTLTFTPTLALTLALTPTLPLTNHSQPTCMANHW